MTIGSTNGSPDRGRRFLRNRVATGGGGTFARGYGRQAARQSTAPANGVDDLWSGPEAAACAKIFGVSQMLAMGARSE